MTGKHNFETESHGYETESDFEFDGFEAAPFHYEEEAPAPSPSPRGATPGRSAGAISARILWPALGFPAVIAPRQGASANPAQADATRSICVLVLTDRPLTRDHAARHLRCVPWKDRRQRSVPTGQRNASFSPQELMVQPVTPTGVQDDAKLGQAFSFGGGPSTAVTVSLSRYVLDKYRFWGFRHLSEIRVSERASLRLADGHQYHLFWNQEQPDPMGVSSEMRVLLERFARGRRNLGPEWQRDSSFLLNEYKFEYGSLHEPYKQKERAETHTEVLHPVFVRKEPGSVARIAHVTDTHVSVRHDVFERNLKGMCIEGNPNLIQFNNWNRSFDSVYGKAKSNSDVILMTGDLIDYGRGHIGRPENDERLGEDGHYHLDRNWFLFYYLLAGNDPAADSKPGDRYTTPVYTTLGNHDWRVNPYPPFAPGSEDPKAFIYNVDKFPDDLAKIMRKAHGPGWERVLSYRLDVNNRNLAELGKREPRWRDYITAAKKAPRDAAAALRGLLVTSNLDIIGTPLQTTIESVAWYLLLINPFLDYQFSLRSGHRFLMLDWAQDEEVKHKEDLPLTGGKDYGVRAARCLTSLQKWHVEGFLASDPNSAKTIGIHMPPIGPRSDWTDTELATGQKEYKGLPPMVAWERMRGAFPLLAVAPEGFYQWLAASRGSFVKNRTWFVQRLAKMPRHGVRLVLSGHIHRSGVLVVRPATLVIPKKGWILPEKHEVLKVTSVSPQSREWAAARGGAFGPLYVNTTSTGPRGVRNSSGDEEYTERPGFTLVQLENNGVIRAIWQGPEPPAAWSAGNGMGRRAATG